jgi:hypothetical protein
VTFGQTSENWTADAFEGRTVAPQATATWAAPPSVAGRHGVGVAIRLPDIGDELRVIIDPETSDILQSSEVLPPPPATRPKLPAGGYGPPWPPPAALAERTQVFLSTGSVAALGDRP